MKKISFILLLILISLSTCSNNGSTLDYPPKHIEEQLLLGFSVWIGDKKIEAIIDEVNKRATLSGLVDISAISKVEYKLPFGANIYPEPNTKIGNWKKEEQFLIRKPGQSNTTYTILAEGSNLMQIKTSELKQQILLLGGDMERSQHFLQQAANPEEIANWCFKDIKFNVCRVAYDKKQEMVEGTKTMEFYADVIKSMQMVKKANSNIEFWATMKSDYNGYDGQNNLPDWICNYKPTTWFNTQKYAVFLADYLGHMQANNVGIKYLAIAKEWVDVVNANRAKEVITFLNQECVKRGIVKPLYVDPSSWGITQGVNFIKAAKTNGSIDLYYGFSTHNLNSSESAKMLYENFVTETKGVSKHAFADETGTGAGGKTSGEEPTTMQTGTLNVYVEKCEFYKDGIEGEIFFEPFSRGVASETRTIYFQKGTAGKRMRAYYVMKEFANSIAGATYYYIPSIQSLGDGVHAMAFTDKKEVSYCVINSTSAPFANVSILVDTKTNNEKVAQTLFDINQPIEGTHKLIESNGNQFITDLPSYSITFFRIKL